MFATSVLRILLFLCLLYPSATFAGVIDLRQVMDGEQVGLKADILTDKDGMLLIGEVASPKHAATFESHAMDTPNFGFSAAAYWLRLTFRNPEGAGAGPWYLVADFPSLDLVDLHCPNKGGGYTADYSGDFRPFSARKVFYRSPAFMIAPPAGDTTCYLRVKANPLSVILIPLKIWSAEEFRRHEVREYAFFGILSGFMLVMFLYNLFLFGSTRDYLYLTYVAYLAFIYIVTLALNGLGAQFVWPEHYRFQNEAIAVFMCVAAVLGVQFNRAFLDTKKASPRFDMFLLIIMAILAAFASLSLFKGYYIAEMATSAVFVASVPILVNAVDCWAHGVRHARIYIFGWTAILVGGGLMVLRNFAVIPDNLVSTWGLQVSTAAEVVIFSLALGDRINMMRERETALIKEKEMADAAIVMKDKFVALMGHDLRTPLASIYGYLRMIKEDLANKGRAAEVDGHMDRVVRMVQDMDWQLDTLLKTSRLKTGKLALAKAPIGVWDLVEQVRGSSFLPAEAKGVAIVNDVPPGMVLTADAALFHEVVQNLVSNAVKFTGKGGAVTVFSPDGGKKALAVRDTGVGISQRRIGALFEYEIKTSTAGTDGETGCGLGLPLTRDIVHEHGGTIDVESTVGEGSTFTVRLP